MDFATASTLFLVAFWIYMIATTMRTHRLLKNAYEEQYGL
jgi:hypothetical protein